MADSDIEIDPEGLGPVAAALVDASAQFSAGAETLRGLGDYLDPGAGGLAGVGDQSLGPPLSLASQTWHRTIERLAESALELATAVDLTTTLYSAADAATAADLARSGG